MTTKPSTEEILERLIVLDRIKEIAKEENVKVVTLDENPAEKWVEEEEADYSITPENARDFMPSYIPEDAEVCEKIYKTYMQDRYKELDTDYKTLDQDLSNLTTPVECNACPVWIQGTCSKKYSTYCKDENRWGYEPVTDPRVNKNKDKFVMPPSFRNRRQVDKITVEKSKSRELKELCEKIRKKYKKD